jgi:PAS domain S-box-containing protein
MWANNVAKLQFGLHLTGKKCYKVLLRQIRPCRDCIALKTFTDGKIHENEKSFININGEKSHFWCSSSTAGLNFEGKTEFAIMILRDITNRKLMEETLIQSEQNLKLLNKTLVQKIEERTKDLRTSEEYYKKILDNLDVGFYKGEFKGKLLMHNAAFNKILNLNKDISLIGTNSSKFLSDPEDHRRYHTALLENGTIKNYVTKIETPSGDIVQVQLNSHLIRDADGNPKEVEGTIIKISDNSGI